MSTNPFATKFVRPGAIEYRFPQGMSLPALFEQFLESGQRAQIVGPHGTGKSTLLASLGPLVEQHFDEVIRVQLHAGDGRRASQPDWGHLASRGPKTLVMVDGFEQAYAWHRWWFERRARGGPGLLVTAHRPLGKLPVLYTSGTGATVVKEIVQRLLAGQTPQPSAVDMTSEAWVERRLTAHHGNVRELLFELYDHWEQLPTPRP